MAIRQDAEINADFIRDYAFSIGESINHFIHRAIIETMQSDGYDVTELLKEERVNQYERLAEFESRGNNSGT